MTLQELRQNRLDFEIRSKKSQLEGNLHFKTLRVARRYTFLEYVFGGCEINLSIAVDFTLSNGPPNDKDSLHYFDMNKNEYLQAITQVGSILQYYDSDKKIPFFGFGAKIPPVEHRASHCFAVNGDIFDPECDGLDGVIDAYKHALQKV